MSYRRSDESRRWQKWCKRHSDLIIASGLPTEFFESEHSWLVFLEHGYYEYSPDVENPLSWFSLDKLNVEQNSALSALIQLHSRDEDSDVV